MMNKNDLKTAVGIFFICITSIVSGYLCYTLGYAAAKKEFSLQKPIFESKPNIQTDDFDKEIEDAEKIFNDIKALFYFEDIKEKYPEDNYKFDEITSRMRDNRCFEDKESKEKPACIALEEQAVAIARYYYAKKFTTSE